VRAGPVIDYQELLKDAVPATRLPHASRAGIHQPAEVESCSLP
jgi:hypothetical protein